MTNFLGDRRGNFAVITALAALPIFAGMGMAMDYSRALKARDLFQDRADATALSIARQGPTGTDLSMLTHTMTTLPSATEATNVVVNGRWTSVNEYTVTVSGNLPLTVTQILPSAGSTMPVSAEAVARYKEATRQYKPPTMTLLDPEAGDYNRIYAYCFNADKKSGTGKGRSGETAIADNGGTTYSNPMPICGAGEAMSFRLFNVRGSRTTKGNWDNASVENYNYYTDTTLKPQETYDLGGWAILETVLCNNLDECKGKDKGGIIPVGKNKNPPARATSPCLPGKFMYYGWEDRPPGRGDSDRDYDDIRVIIECPVEIISGEQVVRLVR
jgi:hypothetical protein